MHDFYNIIKTPYSWFFPISADIIDENATLESLIDTITGQLHPPKKAEPANPTGNLDDLEKKNLEHEKNIILLVFQAQLVEMREKSYSYQSVDAFKKVLERRFLWQNYEKLLEDNKKFLNLDETGIENIQPLLNQLKTVKLDGVKVTIHRTPFLERVNSWNWNAVDIGCVALYLQGWKFLDTAKLAASLGQYQGLQWLQNQHLDRWVVGLVCSAYLLKFVEACRKLRYASLTSEQRIQAQWDRFYASAEFILWLTVLLNQIDKIKIDNTYIYCLAIIVKSIGLISIAARPKHQFFQKAAAPAA
jgi:hypothetical protein